MVNNYAQLVQSALDASLPMPLEGTNATVGEIPGLLTEAMRYSLLQGGKRLRPAMLLAATQMLGGDLDEAMPYACAIEMIHCYSLIHDDLPGMDDDELRRGKPTNHMVYGIGQAILAGDGLLSLAVETMQRSAIAHPDNLLSHTLAAAEIMRGAGVRGMVAGQSLDLLLEHKPTSKASDLNFIQENKTAALFIYALRAAGRLCAADEKTMTALEDYGRAFGMLFQTVDDLLDEQGDEATLGKKTGKDRESGKLTAVSLYGPGGAAALKPIFLNNALEALSGFGKEADYFRELIEAAATRRV